MFKSMRRAQRRQDIARLHMARELTQELLKSLLIYDAETGIFTWKINRQGGFKAGDVAGGLNSDGYVQIYVLGRNYYGHRLAWFYMFGIWPTKGFVIDHKDTNRSNNRWENLREATRSTNSENSHKSHRDSKTGLQGSVQTPSRKFKSEIGVKGKKIFLGTFDTAEDAHEAYLRAKRFYHKGSTL